MFHSIFVLICPKVGDSVFFRVSSETVASCPFPTRAIRSGARQSMGLYAYSTLQDTGRPVLWRPGSFVSVI
jgi:hypothetical protein